MRSSLWLMVPALALSCADPSAGVDAEPEPRRVPVAPRVVVAAPVAKPAAAPPPPEPVPTAVPSAAPGGDPGLLNAVPPELVDDGSDDVKEVEPPPPPKAKSEVD